MDSLFEAYAVLDVEPTAADDELHKLALTKLKTDLYGDPEGEKKILSLQK